MSTNISDNQRQVVHNEETVQSEQPAGQPGQTAVSQTKSAAAAQPASTPAAPSEQYTSRSVSDNVVDPAANKAAGIEWLSKVVWLIVGVMSALIAIRFVLLAVGANENAGFAKFVYGLTGWMVAPFAALFGSNLTYPGTAGTGSLEAASLVAIVVYALVGLLITKVAQLMLGTNRTTGSVYSETTHKTKV